MKKSKKLFLSIVVGVLAVVSVCVGFFAPGYLAQKKSISDEKKVMMVPEKLYSSKNTEFAKRASERLTDEDRLRLITGEWESVNMDAEHDEMKISSYEIVDIAKAEINKLYQSKKIDFFIESELGNWYSWTAYPKKAVDKTFNTYIAYYWEIEFEKYDHSEKHFVRIMESGNILEIE